MAFIEHTDILTLIFIFIPLFMYIYRQRKKHTVIPTNWPVLGMIPGILVNSHRIHDYIVEGLIHTCRSTFKWKGPWFANMDTLITADPLDIQHVLCKNFINYPKGDNYRKIFDIFGNGIVTSDGKLWEIHRKFTTSLLRDAKDPCFWDTIIWDKVENGLQPVLESISGQGLEMDLHDIFDRFTFDTTCKLIWDHDPESLSLDFPSVPFLKAFSDVGDVIVHRHVRPQSLWKLQQLLGVGNEKKMSDAWRSIDDFMYKFLAKQDEEYDTMKGEHQEKKVLLCTALMREIKDQCGDFGDPKILLRDTLLSLMSAGKDTISSALSWFMYMVAKNPTVEDNILKELHTYPDKKTGERWSPKELGEMIYLHGALNESLRLFPPLPNNHKIPLQPDILPSGHKVDKNTKIILSFYAMGRMKSVWGDDCMEFKPERWISESGRIKHEPSYKFATFNAGPRTCLGRDISLSQLKIVTATIIYNYHIELVEGHPVLPADSILLQMKHGLRVRLTKRSD